MDSSGCNVPTSLVTAIDFSSCPETSLRRAHGPGSCDRTNETVLPSEGQGTLFHERAQVHRWVVDSAISAASTEPPYAAISSVDLSSETLGTLSRTSCAVPAWPEPFSPQDLFWDGELDVNDTGLTPDPVSAVICPNFPAPVSLETGRDMSDCMSLKATAPLESKSFEPQEVGGTTDLHTANPGHAFDGALRRNCNLPFALAPGIPSSSHGPWASPSSTSSVPSLTTSYSHETCHLGSPAFTGLENASICTTAEERVISPLTIEGPSQPMFSPTIFDGAAVQDTMSPSGQFQDIQPHVELSWPSSEVVHGLPIMTFPSDLCINRRPNGGKDNAKARRSDLYQLGPQEDGFYHCPFARTEKCTHKPEKLKCNYDKHLDSHLKPYRCKVPACGFVPFSSTACLLRHEREAHGMHGHGEKPFLCSYQDCDRSVQGNGFPRRWNLQDHKKRIHDKSRPAHSKFSLSGHEGSKSSRKRKTVTSSASPNKAAKTKASNSGRHKDSN